MKRLFFTIGIFVLFFTPVFAETIDPLPQFTSTTTPINAITQRTYAKAIKISGVSDGCLYLSSSLITSNVANPTCTGGGGGGGPSIGEAWAFFNNKAWLAPTTTVGIIVNASSTIFSLTTGDSTSTNATTSSFNISVGPLGIGTPRPKEVNANSLLTVSKTGAVAIVASTTDDTTSSAAVLETYAAGGIKGYLGSHGQSQVVSRFGLTLGKWVEIAATGTTAVVINGMVIGTVTDAPLVFGTNNLERFRVASTTGNIGINLTTPNFAKLEVQGTTTTTGVPLAIWNSAGTGLLTVVDSGNIGVGSTSPFGQLSVNPNGVTGPEFVIGSSTRTHLIVTNQGFVGIGTTSSFAQFSIGTTSNPDPRIPSSFFDVSSTSSGSNGTTTDVFNITFSTTTTQTGLNTTNGSLITQFSTGITTIGSLVTGNQTTDNDAGQVTWFDEPQSSALSGTIQSYTAFMGTINPILTVYGVANGNGTTIKNRLGIGTTSPSALVTTWATTSTSELIQNWVNAASTTLMVLNGSGNLGIGTSTPTAIIDSYTSASSTSALLEAASGKGGCLIIKDVGTAVAYTELYTNGGILYSKVSTSLTTCN